MFAHQGVLRWSRPFAWGSSNIRLCLPDEERGNENLLSHIGASRFNLWGQRLQGKATLPAVFCIILCSAFFCVYWKVTLKDIWDREEGGGFSGLSNSERTAFRWKVYFSTVWKSAAWTTHYDLVCTQDALTWMQEGSPQRLTRLRLCQC